MSIIKLTLPIVLVLNLMLVVTADGQEKSFQTTYYEQRRTLFESLPNSKKEIIFLGNSITDGGEWAELFQNKRIKNRGISGDVTEGLLFRLYEVTESKPAKVFLLIGINDLARGISKDTVFNNIYRIASLIEEHSPKTKVYIQSILPVNPEFGKFSGHCSKTEEIMWINQQLREWCAKTSVPFVDLFSHFKNEDNNWINPSYTNDGLHLTGEGYQLWATIIQRLL
ncbi:GDSL-type esterase/lipase family protein [Gaoshiqia sediminis]|uniref:GDSL-type esterase/lipase family protein n=1 Tax=Gaoshiqia sediminis TaxID=2986998 RepID=A0AA42CAK6_9BACT|nr:GDSL-type esterase/lipase family protein [Gaoshiqia sediminis]MCW0483902.1 GDSL-type esterase/lipase family protein [Gaoshiqia sediminis]